MNYRSALRRVSSILLILLMGFGLPAAGSGIASASSSSMDISAAAAAAPKCPANITRKMCTLYKAMYKVARKGDYLWDDIGCYRQDPLPYHPEGRACDLVYGKIGKKATGDNLRDGDKLKNWLIRNHAKFNLDHVIWQQRIYSARTNWSSAGRPQPCSGVTDCHRDHVHVAVNR